ncbi:hypothetical protein [Comamonas aquatilis]|uniref:hypothetical protein n=1 Tax=Comamonas aquatilis TaxID=1778406 RepID=UPI0039F035AA
MSIHRFSVHGLAVLALLLGAAAAHAQAYISGAISGQLAPGVYGRVDIGNAPPPALMYAQPMLGMPGARAMPHAQPIYLWVPPDHSRNWRRYCGRYSACGQQVYFLRNAPPHWREARRDRHDHHHGRGWERERHDERRWQREERRERDWDRDGRGGRGHGNGHGRGHDRHDD